MVEGIANGAVVWEAGPMLTPAPAFMGVDRARRTKDRSTSFGALPMGRNGLPALSMHTRERAAGKSLPPNPALNVVRGVVIFGCHKQIVVAERWTVAPTEGPLPFCGP